MKKIVITILAFLYISFASGVVMNMHYCMGQLSSVDYGYDHQARCDNCGMTEKQGCCNTEFKIVKLHDSHQLAKSTGLANNHVTTVLASSTEHLLSTLKINEVPNFIYYSPPDPRKNSIYLHTSILRI